MAQNIIAILKDDPSRVEAMRAVLARDLPASAVEVHGAARRMIDWLRAHLDQTSLVSLDNDLLDPADLVRNVGEGRDVAEMLVREMPCCPIILHTSNSTAARAMSEILGEANWPLARVMPHDDLEWVEEWVGVVRRLLVDGCRG